MKLVPSSYITPKNVEKLYLSYIQGKETYERFKLRHLLENKYCVKYSLHTMIPLEEKLKHFSKNDLTKFYIELINIKNK